MKIHEVPPGSVVVGVDGSEHAERALEWAADAAARERRPLAILHCSDPMSPVYGSAVGAWVVDWTEVRRVASVAARHELGAAAARARARHADLRVCRVDGIIDPRVGLTAVSRQAHLLVLGSRGKGPISSVLLGSVSVAVTRQAACPVVVVRPGPVPEPGAPVVVIVDDAALAAPALELGYRFADELGTCLRVVSCRWPTDPGAAEEMARLDVGQAVAGLGEKHPDVAVEVQVVHGPAPGTVVPTTLGAALAVVGHHPGHGLLRAHYGSLAASVLERATCPVAVVPDSLAAPDAVRS